MARRLPSLNQLRAFEAAARHLSIKAGAEELCVTPAAVGHQIKALEQDLQTPLFIRQTRKIALTEAGKELAESVSQALDLLEATTRQARSPRAASKLKLTVAPFFGNRWLLPKLEAFRAAHPNLEIETALSFDYVDLEGSDFDAAVRFGDGDWRGLASHLIFRDRIGPVCAPQLIQGRNAPLSAVDLLSLPLACARNWPHDWQAWAKAAGLSNANLANVTQYDSRAFMFDAAFSGQAVILADQRMTAADEAAGRLVRLHALTVERPQGIYVVTSTARPSPALEPFVAWLRQEADGPTP